MLQKKKKKQKLLVLKPVKIAQRMYIRLPVRQTKSPMFNVTATYELKGLQQKTKKKPLVSKISNEQQVVILEQNSLAIEQ